MASPTFKLRKLANQAQYFTTPSRFSAIDKRNQNLIAKSLRSEPASLFNASDARAETKARRFFHACAGTPSASSDGGGGLGTAGTLEEALEEHDKKNLMNLQAIVSFAGGWKLTGVYNDSVGFDERVQIIHNKVSKIIV